MTTGSATAGLGQESPVATVACLPCPDLLELSAETLRQFTARDGIDVATKYLYDRLQLSGTHVPFIRRIDALCQEGEKNCGHLQATLAIAPGAFYREFPHTGADGRLLGEQAQKLGCQTVMIPTRSTGRLTENARRISQWLAARPEGEKIILASVSKGGSDIKLALSQPDASDTFRNVVAWINVCGILDGSPMVNWLRSHKLRWLFYRSMFLLRGFDFRVISDLAHGAGSLLDFDLALPPRMRAIHVIGFPRTDDLTSRLSKTCHRRISPQGPNDGAVLLADVCRLPGLIYPVWGADHYMRPAWEFRRLARALLLYLGEELNLLARADQEIHPRPCP